MRAVDFGIANLLTRKYLEIFRKCNQILLFSFIYNILLEFGF